jgi:hypothetical protein
MHLCIVSSGPLILCVTNVIGVSRSIWMGLEWIRYVLLKMWEMEGAGKEKVFIRGYNVAEIFKQRYNAIPKSLRKKFKYYRPFLR